MLSAVTVPPYCSLISRAVSRALRSSGLKTVANAPRLTVPSAFIASTVIFDVSGTCLTQTTLSYGTMGVSSKGKKVWMKMGKLTAVWQWVKTYVGQLSRVGVGVGAQAGP